MAGQHQFHTILKERINEMVEKRSKELATGSARDYGEYSYSAGYNVGLLDALKIAEEIEREFDPK